jgi:hypothetical protein
MGMAIVGAGVQVPARRPSRSHFPIGMLPATRKYRGLHPSSYLRINVEIDGVSQP